MFDIFEYLSWSRVEGGNTMTWGTARTVLSADSSLTNVNKVTACIQRYIVKLEHHVAKFYWHCVIFNVLQNKYTLNIYCIHINCYWMLDISHFSYRFFISGIHKHNRYRQCKEKFPNLTITYASLERAVIKSY